jgi:2-polyprenyl-6-methoxyphenol hydroxylase-like FAD-dependent oxidoreductase
VVATATPCTPRHPAPGQGASLALEDIVVLAQCLRDLPSPEEAFAAYQRIRQPRAEQVVGFAQEITKHKTICRNPLAMTVRDYDVQNWPGSAR